MGCHYNFTVVGYLNAPAAPEHVADASLSSFLSTCRWGFFKGLFSRDLWRATLSVGSLSHRRLAFLSRTLARGFCWRNASATTRATPVLVSLGCILVGSTAGNTTGSFLTLHIFAERDTEARENRWGWGGGTQSGFLWWVDRGSSFGTRIRTWRFALRTLRAILLDDSHALS